MDKSALGFEGPPLDPESVGNVKVMLKSIARPITASSCPMMAVRLKSEMSSLMSQLRKDKLAQSCLYM